MRTAVGPTPTEPRRTLDANAIAIRGWTVHQRLAAAGFSVSSALLIGIPTVLAWFAVGCPVCNKLALLVLAYSGAITWFAPVQPYLAGVALALTAGALLRRTRGQTFCPAAPAVSPRTTAP